MSTLGVAWSGEDNISAARMNAKTIWQGTGTQLNGLSPLYPGQIVVSLDASAGFNADFVYYRSADNQSWKPLSMAKHTHDTDFDSSGGLLSDIYYANVYESLFVNEVTPNVGGFITGDTSGGTVFNDITSSTGKLRVETGVVANNYVHILKYGLKLKFSRKSRMSVKMGLDVGTNLVTRVSVCGESTNLANNNNRKYGIEGCTSTGSNWQLFTGSGTGRTGNIDTGTVLAAGADTTGKNYRLDAIPNLNVKFYNDGVNCGANCTKSTDIPSTGDSGQDYIIRIGTKTTDTVNKKIGIWGIKLAGSINDTWF
jgi:hypothetical protein